MSGGCNDSAGSQQGKTAEDLAHKNHGAAEAEVVDQ